MARFPDPPSAGPGRGNTFGGPLVVPIGAVTGMGLGPRSVSTTTAAPELPGGGLTLDALMARQKELANRSIEMPEMRSPWQGVAYAAQQALQGFQTGRAEREAADARDALARAISGVDPTTGQVAPDAMTTIAALDPSAALNLKSAQMERTWRVQDREDEQAAALELQKLKGTGEGAPKLSDLATLRDDYKQSATTYEQAAPSWQSMKEAATVALSEPGVDTPGKGAADYNMIVGFAKLLDPQSVVREGEVASATNLGGYIDTVQGWLNQWKLNGGKLDDDVRKAIMTQADSRMRAYYDQVKSKRDWMTGIAGRHGIDINDVAPPLPEYQGWQQQQAAQPTIDQKSGEIVFPPDWTPQQIRDWARKQQQGG